MFMYLRVPHVVLETCRSLAATSISAELPSGKAPTTLVRRLAQQSTYSGGFRPLPGIPAPRYSKRRHCRHRPGTRLYRLGYEPLGAQPLFRDRHQQGTRIMADMIERRVRFLLRAALALDRAGPVHKMAARSHSRQNIVLHAQE